MYINLYTYIYNCETPAFGGISLALRESGASGRDLWVPSAAVKEDRKKKKFGAPKKKKIGASTAPHSLKNFRRGMRIPNKCLVLKLDNGKVVSIVNE